MYLSSLKSIDSTVTKYIIIRVRWKRLLMLIKVVDSRVFTIIYGYLPIPRILHDATDQIRIEISCI